MGWKWKIAFAMAVVADISLPLGLVVFAYWLFKR